MIKTVFTFDSYFTVVTSSAKDARSIMAFSYHIFVFGILTALCGRCTCDVIANSVEIANNSNNNNSNAAPTDNNFSEPVISIKNTTKLYPDRYARFLNTNGHLTPMKSVEDNEIDDKQDTETEDPTAPLYGIYYDCLFRLNFQCVQRKLLMFLDRLSRLKSFNVIGDVLAVVRTTRDLGPKIKEDDLKARLNSGDSSNALSTLLEYTLERFLKSHVIRFTLPIGVTASVSGNVRFSEGVSGNTIDINITRALEETTGRGKGDKKMKKLMGMVMTGLMGKMAFMGPFMVLMIKLKALKALILSKIALMLSLMHLFKGGKKGGGGHGKEVIIVHDGHGGGGNADLTSSGWPGTGNGGWSGNGGGWFSSHDSYSQGSNTGGGDATYAGSDQAYSTGANAGTSWTNGGGAQATHAWGRRSSSGDPPRWVTYRAFIPDTDERK